MLKTELNVNFLLILGEFIRFVPVTLVPFEPNMIDFTMLNPSQINWYNEYNQLIRKNIVPRLQETEDEKTIKWILSRTKPVNPYIGFKKEL